MWFENTKRLLEFATMYKHNAVLFKKSKCLSLSCNTRDGITSVITTPGKIMELAHSNDVHPGPDLNPIKNLWWKFKK